MLRFGKTTEYALLALMHLDASESGAASARQIAAAFDLPLPLLSKILKSLHHNGLLESTRGSKGGYRIAVDLRDVSLERLMTTLRLGSYDRLRWADDHGSIAMKPTEPPLLALHAKMRRFLREVRLSDLIVPGRRIDVPVELVGRPRASKAPTTELAAAGL